MTEFFRDPTVRSILGNILVIGFVTVLLTFFYNRGYKHGVRLGRLRMSRQVQDIIDTSPPEYPRIRSRLEDLVRSVVMEIF